MSPDSSCTSDLKSPVRYSNDTLVRMSMSPIAISAPVDWDRICKEHPYVVRKVSVS